MNEPHVTVTQASAQFAMDEIRNGGLGIGESNFAEKYILSQNPVSENITIKLNNSYSYSEVIIKVNSLTGQQLQMEKYVNPTGEISLKQSLSSGIYLLNIKDAHTSYNLKFIVK